MEKQIQLPESCDSEPSESGEISCSERVSLSSEEESLILHLETEDEPEDEPTEDLPKQSNEEVEMNNLEIQVPAEDEDCQLLPSTSPGITWKHVVDDKERSPDEETPDEERSDLEYDGSGEDEDWEPQPTTSQGTTSSSDEVATSSDAQSEPSTSQGATCSSDEIATSSADHWRPVLDINDQIKRHRSWTEKKNGVRYTKAETENDKIIIVKGPVNDANNKYTYRDKDDAFKWFVNCSCSHFPEFTQSSNAFRHMEKNNCFAGDVNFVWDETADNEVILDEEEEEEESTNDEDNDDVGGGGGDDDDDDDDDDDYDGDDGSDDDDDNKSKVFNVFEDDDDNCHLNTRELVIKAMKHSPLSLIVIKFDLIIFYIMEIMCL